MSSGERSTNERLDGLSLTLDRVLGIVQDHSGGLAELKTDLGALRVDVQQIRLSFDRLNDHVLSHVNWHIGQQPGGPTPGS